MRQPTVLQLDVGEEKRGGIEREVVGQDVNKRVSEQTPPFSVGERNGVVDEPGRELTSEQRQIKRNDERAKDGEFTAPELTAERSIKCGKLWAQRQRDDALVE